MAEGTSSLDDQLSQRFIDLDPSGYFLIKLDAEAGELIAEHYTKLYADLARGATKSHSSQDQGVGQ